MSRSFGSGVKLVWGCESFGPGFGQGLNAADSAAALSALAEFGITELDTARIYGDGEAEPALGAALRASSVPTTFDIATKAHPKFSLEHDALLEQVSTSLAALRVDSVGILYLHAPDADAVLEGALGAVDELHREGKIREFGLSNFPAWQVVQVYYKCKELGYVLPTVYQGNYNPLARQAEASLLPALKMCGLRFYAYSPLAGGLLVGTAKLKDTSTRAGYRQGLAKMMGGDGEEGMAALEASLVEIESSCEAEGVPMRDAALRWLFHHSPLGEGDAVIIGTSKLSQLTDNLESLSADEGPLPEAVLSAIEGAWESASAGQLPAYPGGGAMPVAGL